MPPPGRYRLAGWECERWERRCLLPPWPPEPRRPKSISPLALSFRPAAARKVSRGSFRIPSLDFVSPSSTGNPGHQANRIGVIPELRDVNVEYRSDLAKCGVDIGRQGVHSDYRSEGNQSDD